MRPWARSQLPGAVPRIPNSDKKNLREDSDQGAELLDEGFL